MDEARVRTVARAISIGRVAIGIGALVAPSLASRVFRFPEELDNPSTRAFGRLFGAREIGVGLLTLRGLDEGASLRGLTAVNALMDGADTFTFALPIVAREGIDQAAVPAVAMAAPVALTWLSMLRSLDAAGE